LLLVCRVRQVPGHILRALFQQRHVSPVDQEASRVASFHVHPVIRPPTKTNLERVSASLAINQATVSLLLVPHPVHNVIRTKFKFLFRLQVIYTS
jgi:hypothetical protein